MLLYIGPDANQMLEQQKDPDTDQIWIKVGIRMIILSHADRQTPR